MKTRFILIALLALASSNLYAQFGVQVGYVYMPSNGNLTLGNFNEFSGTTRNHGVSAGITYDFRIRGSIGMQTALLYTFAGGTHNELRQENPPVITGSVQRGTQTVTNRYQFLELPVRVSYSLPVTHYFRFFFFGGPSFSYALNGSSRSRITGPQGQRVLGNYDNVFDTFNDRLSPFELRLGGGIGAFYRQFQVKIGYDHGILNQYSGSIRHRNSLRRNQFAVSFGYVF